MARLRIRLTAVAISGGVLLAGLAGSATGTSDAEKSSVSGFARSIDAAPGVALRATPLARAATTWRGGLITTSTGETVNVRVSDALPVETATPEAWAEFLVGLAHGPEISQLTAYIATLAEVQAMCGTRALGCYSRDQMVAPGETIFDGTTPEEVIRHEYGHHVAIHRLNSPWVAVDWGPKHWASAATVCSRVTRSEAFPGDEGSNYARNPGEAWAEVYRLMDERRAGITTASWPIIAPSFYPDEPALQAAERDVLQPWTAGKRAVFTRTFKKSTPRTWWIPLATPLDGELRINVTVPKNGLQQVALVGADRRTVLSRALWIGQRAKRLTSTVCGPRTLFVRVIQSGALGRVTVSATTP